MERNEIFQATIARFLEPVHEYLEDPAVSEIMINGPSDIYIERAGLVTRTDAVFADEGALESAARNIAQFTNKRITADTSRFDSRLPDGSRVHVVLPRCSQKGLCISIRRFSKKSFTLEGLVERGAFTDDVREYIEIVVAIEKNLIVSGGTGTGKTSLLNAISGKIPATERIIVIEDSSELQLQQPHVLPFETRMPDRHDRGGVTIRELFHSALRMRPDRIVIGECRGGEALDMLQAMTSGHGGAMSTLHANSAADSLHRLETMALMSGIEIPLTALRAQVASAIDVVVQLSRLNDGRRVLMEVSEVGPLSTDFRYGVTKIYEYSGDLKSTRWTGNRSAFGDEVRQKGYAPLVDLTREVFAVEAS